MSETLKIGELATRSGVGTKTVRYYELLGLLRDPERTDSGYRLYGEADVKRLVFIKKAKELGFSLSDTKEILEVHDAGDSPCVHVLAILDRKIHEIDSLVQELREFQEELVQLRDESAARAEHGAEGAICGIVERGIHQKGEVALAWLESRQS